MIIGLPRAAALAAGVTVAFVLNGCAWMEETFRGGETATAPGSAARADIPSPTYLIGPGDTLEIFVWRQPELTRAVAVRPDGRISVPLIEDLEVTGKTPTELARDIEEELSTYVQDPLVTVIVSNFVGPFSQQVRVVGEATSPQALYYRDNMTLLDVMINVGGLTDFAAGNRATLVRTVDGEQRAYRVRLDDLIKDGDISANAPVLPGDVLIIPEAYL